MKTHNDPTHIADIINGQTITDSDVSNGKIYFANGTLTFTGDNLQVVFESTGQEQDDEDNLTAI